MDNSHAMTLRITEEAYDRLKLISEVRGIPISVVVREAIDSHTDYVIGSESFQESLRKLAAAYQRRGQLPA